MDAGDERMADALPIGGLWIRRQVFEHSVAVPLLTSASASQIDFARLAAELAAASVNMDPAAPPAVSYADWLAAAGLHARLESSADAGVVIEALETNAPDAFVACNDPEMLAPGQQRTFRELNIPVPELLALIRLHAAATIASRFRESAHAVWPEKGDAPASPAAGTQPPASSPPPPGRPGLSPLPIGQAAPPGVGPVSPRVSGQRAANVPSPLALRIPVSPGSPAQTSVPPGSPGADALVRKKTPTALASMLSSQSSILASAQHSLQRETQLVSANITQLLAVVAASYGLVPEESGAGEGGGGTKSGSGATAAESGKLVRCNSDGKSRRGSSDSSDGSNVTVKSLMLTRSMFEHLSFLLTTTLSESGALRPISSIVPQWRDPAATTKVRLGELVDLVRAALVRETPAEEPPGAIDVAEFTDLERKTILRTTLPDVNAGGVSYPHGREVRIANCSEAHFYLLRSLGRVSMIACRDCTLFVGACVSVSLINCVNVRVHAVARVCRATNCFDTHMYLCTNRKPQIVGDNRGLVFAPYNAAYPDAVRDMAEVGVTSATNMWDQFYRPVYRSERGADPDLTPAVASALPPEKFLPFSVPVKNPGAKADPPPNVDRDSSARGLFSMPFKLPPEYAAALVSRKIQFDMIKRDIRSADAAAALTAKKEAAVANDVAMSDAAASPRPAPLIESPPPQHKGMLQAIVNDRFREWLTNSGKMRQLSDLVRMDQDADSRSKTPERQVR